MFPRLVIAMMMIGLLLPATRAEANPYQLSYGGRLAEASGKPVSGPVDLRVTFFRSVSGADQVAVTLADFTGVALSDGIFQIAIQLSPADFHTLFNGVDQAFIQVEDLTHAVTYPRQKFSAVPYALKVPVDGTSITYNTNGRLSLGNGSTTLTLPATAGAANQVLKTNGSGVLSWANDETAGAGSVTSAAITDDTIANADINTNAAIAGTKISPNFGAQNVVTTGSVTAASFSGDGSALTNLPAGPLGTSVDSAEIVDDSIVNADIKSNAAIAGTKISPNFGAQNVVTTGSVTAASFSGDGSALTNLPAGPLGTSVDSAEIVNDTIVDADINTNAAIAGTKISPNFGSQNVVTTGNLTGADVKATNYVQTGTVAGAPTVADCDAAAEHGRLRVDTTNNRLYVCSTSGWVLAANNAGALLSTQNLADVGDAALARTNLGLGALATKGSIADGDVASGAAIAGSKISPNFGAQNVVTTGSVTAGSFSGDGSGLTNLPAGSLGTSIDSAEIVDDSIVNADVKSNAAIAGTKISPNFGAQNVVTTGSVTAASFSGDGSALTNLPAGPLGTSVDSAEIVDDSIVNADVKSNAAIAGSKINPDFGSQNVTTTGNVTGAEVKSTSFMQTGTSSGAPAAASCDASGEYGRIILDTTNNVLYVCSTTGWMPTNGTPIVAVRFTRAAVAYNASAATKDAACAAEFGSTYVTADFNDVPAEGWPVLGFSQPALLRFNTIQSGNTYHFNMASGWGSDFKSTYGTAGSYQLACVHIRAPIRYTRATIAASNTDAQKDALCVSEFGTKYMAASFLEIPLNMANDPMAGNVGSFNAAGATVSFAHIQGKKNTIAAGSYSLACIIKP